MLGEKLGLSHQALFDVASTSSGQCWSLTTYCPVPGPVPDQPGQQRLPAGLRRRADAQGSQLAAGRRQRRGRRTPLGAQAAQIYALYSSAPGHAGEDFSAIINWLRGRQSRGA